LRRLSILLVAFLFFYGCSFIYVKGDENKIREYSKIETILSDFSKKIVAYYGKQKMTIPRDFDEKRFIEVLEKAYPDQTKVKLIRQSFKIKARSIDNSYSVVLCSPETDSKLMEDFSCTLNKVDIRFWDKEGAYSCTFEENWGVYCK
jgi:hypothetical protein